MKNKMEDLKIIKGFFESEPQLVHASFLYNKYLELSDTDTKKVELARICSEYIQYIANNNKLKGYTDEIIVQRAELLAIYYNFLKENNYDNLFSAQSKFRPSILEEFLYLLFRDYIKDLNGDEALIESGRAQAYTNLFFRAKDFNEFKCNPQVGINNKDQDFAIYREIKLIIDDKITEVVKVPIVAIEAKTYIDKTMLDSIIATAEKLKNGNPHTRFVAVSEYYDVGKKVDPAYSRIDQIYILRCSKRRVWKDINSSVVLRLFKEVKEHIERPWSDIETKMKEEGVIL